MAGPSKREFVTGNQLGGLRVNVGLQFHETIDFDRRGMRRAIKVGGKEVTAEARRLLSRAAISKAGEIPGQQTGRLRRSIGVVATGTKGGWVKIAPRTIKGSLFYPAFLFYGSPSTGLEKRANYMEIALQNKREAVRKVVQSGLRESLVPR